MEIIKVALLGMIFFAFLNYKTEAKLKQVNVVFRHGDRAPDNNGLESFPNNPYKNYKFLPVENGGLNNNGKVREYELGQYLRREYGDFLGLWYLPEDVYARSTFVDRTRMSLQLVLAGLYPPENVQQWDEYLPWQPIPTNFLPQLDDRLLLSYECPRYLYAREKVESAPEIVERTRSFDDLMGYLTTKTGKNISCPIDMVYLYHDLMAMAAMNLELPEWSRDVFPRGELHDGALLEYEVANYGEDLKRLNGGMLLRKITDDMTAACDGTRATPKISLYGGHEFNVAAVLQSLGVWKPHVPRYTSAVIVEMHEEEDECQVKLRHYKGYTLRRGEPIDEYARVPGCDTDDLDEFKSVLGNHIATDDDVNSCDKRSLKGELERGMNVPYALVKPLLDGIYKDEEMRGVLQ